MRLRTFALLLFILPASVGAQAREAWPPPGTELAQLTVHERIMIRIRPSRPTMIRRNRRVIPGPVWSEGMPQRCVPMQALAGAAVSQGGDVDLELIDGRRLRAKLAEDCPSLDFYSGFYLKPTRDGRLCGGRDVLRARSGAVCPIARFRRLQPRPERFRRALP